MRSNPALALDGGSPSCFHIAHCWPDADESLLPRIAMKSLLLPLVALMCAAIPLGAQTFTTLYSFHGGTDGGLPEAGLVIASNRLYGTTTYGGSADKGTVFAVNADGTGFTNLHVFTGGSDGANPVAGLILWSNTLYGTAISGGVANQGTVFAVDTDGGHFTNLYSFSALGTGQTNVDGAGPYAGLVLASNTLYGAADLGGNSGNGTLFALNLDGSDFRILHQFTATSDSIATNADGANPIGALMVLNNVLYGMANSGGTGGYGTIFALNTDGSGFTLLHQFTALSGPSPSTNSDGAYPQASLIASGNMLYGTTFSGGSSGNGTVFGISTNGSGFTNLHSFTAATWSPDYINSDGAWPNAALVLSGNTLYSTAYSGGSSGDGTVFAINTDGSGFTNLHNFTNGSDGSVPIAGLVLAENTLYGTVEYNGGAGNGAVFSISFVPQLSITPLQTSVLLSWPANVAGFNYAGFALQCATNLIPPVVWTAVSPGPVVVNGQNTVTNPITGTQMFFRLAR